MTSAQRLSISPMPRPWSSAAWFAVGFVTALALIAVGAFAMMAVDMTGTRATVADFGAKP